MSKRVETDLGGGDDELVIVVRGSACRIQDAQDLVAATLRQIKGRFSDDVTQTKPRPCGCNDQNNAKS